MLTVFVGICTECSLVPTWAAMANRADPNDLVNCHFSAQGLDEITTNRSTESTDPHVVTGMTGYDV